MSISFVPPVAVYSQNAGQFSICPDALHGRFRLACRTAGGVKVTGPSLEIAPDWVALLFIAR
jgi:hypothetical protein